MENPRVRKGKMNVRISLMCYTIGLIVAFFTRRIFLKELGADFVGLTGTLTSLLGFLNLAELGVGTAIGYVLYKPIFEDNKARINEIISVLGYLYRLIGCVVLTAGVILSLFLPLIFPNSNFSMGVIYAGYYAMLSSSLLGYFVNYRMSLLSADQRNYVVTGFFQMTISLKAIVQMIMAIYYRNLYLYFAFEIVFGIVNSIIINIKVNKTYPWLATEIKLGKALFKKYPEIFRYIKQIFVHKIAGFVQFQFSPILVYAFVSLPIVALYTNYTIITDKVRALMNSIFDGTTAGVGNLIAEGNKDKIFNTYQELFSVRFFFSALLACAIYYLVSPFIELWLGSEYQLSSTIVLLLAIHSFLAFLRGATDQFINGYALFYDTWAPIAEASLFVVSAVIFGSFYGLPGVLCGPIISTLIIVYIWKPYFLFKKGFKLPIIKYVKMFFIHFPSAVISFFGASYITGLVFTQSELGASWFKWICGAALFTASMGILQLILFLPIPASIWPFLRRYFFKR